MVQITAQKKSLAFEKKFNTNPPVSAKMVGVFLPKWFQSRPKSSYFVCPWHKNGHMGIIKMSTVPVLRGFTHEAARRGTFTHGILRMNVVGLKWE